MTTMEESSSPMCNLSALESFNEYSIEETADSWDALSAEALLGGINLSLGSNFLSLMMNLCSRGLESLIVEHFLCSMEEVFERNGASMFWKHFDDYSESIALQMDDSDQQGELQNILTKLWKRYHLKNSIRRSAC